MLNGGRMVDGIEDTHVPTQGLGGQTCTSAGSFAGKQTTTPFGESERPLRKEKAYSLLLAKNRCMSMCLVPPEVSIASGTSQQTRADACMELRVEVTLTHHYGTAQSNHKGTVPCLPLCDFL